jgi:hypothetical protein
MSALHNGETDAEGHFSIAGLPWGRYRIFTKKEIAGYPNMAFSFYSNDLFSEATITSTVPSADVQIQLGPKGGVLVGSVTNAGTGAPVNASFKLTRLASPESWLSTSEPPDYRVLLPALADVRVEVSAPGYKTWASSRPINLQPGAEVALNIALEELRDPSAPISEFRIPDGYVGWLRVQYKVEDAAPATIEGNQNIFKFPTNGILATSSCVPQPGGLRHYSYYAENGSIRDVPMGYSRGEGMIWGERSGTSNGIFSEFYFFVGTEAQYKKQGNPGLQTGSPSR